MKKDSAGGDLIREFERGDCRIQVYAFSRDAGDLHLSARLQPLSYGEAENFDFVLGEIESWARQVGLKTLWAPLGPSTYGDYRLKLDHLNDKPFPGEPSNSQDAIDRLHRAGFTATRKYNSHELVLNDRLSAGLKTLMRFNVGLSRLSLRQEFLNPDSLLAKGSEIYDVTHEMFKNHFGYRPIGAENFKNLVLQKVLPLVCWKTSFVLKDADGKIVGYSLHLRDPHDSKRILLKTFGIDPRFPHRAKAFFSLFKNIEEALRGNYERVMFCLVAEGEPTDRLAQKLGPIKSTSYALFSKAIPATASDRAN